MVATLNNYKYSHRHISFSNVLFFISLQLEYQKCNNVDEKIDKTLAGCVVPLSNDYVRKLIKGAVKRVFALKNYKPSYITLKSRLVLFKPTKPSFTHRSEDFGLGEICEKTIPVHTIEGNHTSILLNNDISNHINSYLKL